MNGSWHQDRAAYSRVPESPTFSDIDGDGDDALDEHGGDYSTRLEELLSDEDEPNTTYGHGAEDEDDDEGFFYDGVDSAPTGTYREQLRDVLGPEHEEDDDDELEQQDVKSLMQEVQEKELYEAAMDDEAKPIEASSDPSPSSSSVSPSGYLSPPKVIVSGAPDVPHRTMRPFLHPTISRLRSTTPQASRTPSAGSVQTINSHLGLSTPASHFSALSPTSSQSNLPAAPPPDTEHDTIEQEREVFRWSQLRNVTDLLYGQHAQKAAAVLGTPMTGSPTVLTANGLICIGTDTGRTLVFDFKQNLKCVCVPADNSVGAVTALALSYDHTYLASGHATAHIQLFDLANPKSPARFVQPTTLAAVASGTQEGHLVGSRIVSVGFIAGRHTVLVSADDSGLAFYHSLGKVLFVEASDTLRILGKYPDEDPREPHDTPIPGANHMRHPFRRRRARKVHTILSMSPLPLGPSPHHTDSYQLIALLTPLKLVLVGLKPTPKTWYRSHREQDDEASSSKFKGALAWFPSVASDRAVQQDAPANGKARLSQPTGTTPMLVFGWGRALNMLRVSESKVVQEVKNPKSGKVTKVEIGRITIEEAGRWRIGGDVLALQWLNFNQIIVLTASTLEVYDIHTLKLVEHVPFDAWTLTSPLLAHTTNGSVSYTDAVTEISHSLRVYKGKIFLLGQQEVLVGTLLTWADRILSFVEQGDFLSAIELTRSYYIGEAPGNRNGLPDKPDELRTVVGGKMRELMAASARYAFAEERMTDSTHITPDGRGVDRTSLFEGLVATCARACLALDDLEFLFGDLFYYYDEYGIAKIFLLQLEPFILDSKIHYVPPRITQRLVALHEDSERPDLAERLIWHIDPDCLDINQAITLCQRYHLYDALLYIYTRAMRDYVAPIVELLALIRSVQRYRRARAEASPSSNLLTNESAIEATAVHAYRIYSYLSSVLTGLTYPSEEPLDEQEAAVAKNDVYTFLFFGRSSVWPVGEGGKLILTSDEENGVEPTYPYARLLLRFDAEAFLHTLDLAFEDHYLNDEAHAVNRLVIVKILFEISSTPSISQSDKTFINIFIARNVPKYPQFIQMAPSALHSILIGLAEDNDDDTREDRQLAAEFLLSTYTPHESGRILQLFERAGFWRILRTWHRHDRQWAPLITAYLKDVDLRPAELFTSLDDVLRTASRSNKGKLAPDVLKVVRESVPQLLRVDIRSAAVLFNKHAPDLHEQIWDALQTHSSTDQFSYLRELLGSPKAFDDLDGYSIPRRTGPSEQVPPPLRQAYISLLCELRPRSVIDELKYFAPDFLDWKQVVRTCEDHEVYNAAVWTLNWRGDPGAALAKADTFAGRLAAHLSETLSTPSEETEDKVNTDLSLLQDITQTAVSICLQRSKPDSQGAALPVEDIWFELLKTQINCIHRVAIGCTQLGSQDAPQPSLQEWTLHALRSSVHETFTALLSASLSKVSFPRLFKRLVDSGGHDPVSKGSQYNEFRTILTGMLESYRSEGDMLVITKQLMDQDLFVSVEQLSQARVRGWAASRGVCSACRQRVFNAKLPARSEGEETTADEKVVVTRTGDVYHRRCFPTEHTSID